MAVPGLPLGDVPDSNVLPNPSGEMFEFYEGLDTNLFSESTGINHNSAPKWLKSELLRHLEFLSYLLSVKSNQAIMSDDIVHTDSILDDNVTLAKLDPALRNLLTSLRPENVIERNSVQTFHCISLVAGKISVNEGAIISQANGFTSVGQNDLVEVLTATEIVPSTGETSLAYLYKTVGGAYLQTTTKQNILNLDTMVGTRVLLGTFAVNSSNEVISVTPAIPSFKVRTIEEAVFTGSSIKVPDGGSDLRPSIPSNGHMRFNSDTNEFEGFKSGRWDSIGGGQMLGQAQMKAISYNSQVVDENITIKSGMNAWSVGKITVADGCKITLEDNSVYKIL